MIDELGLKNARIGGAAISSLHANFIINENNASSQDVIQLINKTRELVFKTYDVELQLEVKIVNYDGSHLEFEA